ncbi:MULTISPECIES: hypothetical protein [Pseudomonas]|uniref:Uncharacterized protein n=1 Tax=Pseudomonas lutea TaxID=243924 RepID=A0A9X8MH59_9PSED|nr:MULTISPECIES: hypothetical protein [Pseudomonas]SER37450.1 hypothetical protein SAMN05216409_11896 [Pseudomonas lutea]
MSAVRREVDVVPGQEDWPGLTPYERVPGYESEAENIARLRYFLKEHLFNGTQREAFAKRIGTSHAYLRQILANNRSIPIWMAVNMDRETNGFLDMRVMTSGDGKHAIDWTYLVTVLPARMKKRGRLGK